jgi:hypothetical protein
LTPKACTSCRVLGAGAQVGAEARALDQEPGGQADGDGGDHDPGPVVGQDHEAEIGGAGQQLRHVVGLARDAVLAAEHAFEDQRQAEGEEQAVQRVEPVQALEHQALDDDAEDADDQRREDQRPPVVHAPGVQHDPGGEGADHVQRAVREVHDVEQAEDHREAEAEHGVERAIHQPQHQLAEEGLVGDAEDFHGRFRG